ncbi:MAG: hypothetical protein WDO72_08945 [Pseudomonadota bacterium]
MNAAHSLGRPLAALAAALIVLTPRDAAAVELDTVVLNIRQVGTTAGVSLGHTAIGRTNYNRLTVSGAYTAACVAGVMIPTSGQRSLSREGVIGGFGLITTIPERLPAIVDMPGFELLAAGSRVACAYNWSSKAVEASYTLGIPGFGIAIGAGEISKGSSYPFIMVVPAGGTRDDEGCA